MNILTISIVTDTIPMNHESVAISPKKPSLCQNQKTSSTNLKEQTAMSHQLLTTTELAEKVGVSRWTIATWARNGLLETWGIHPIKIGRKWRFRADEVRDFMG